MTDEPIAPALAAVEPAVIPAPAAPVTDPVPPEAPLAAAPLADVLPPAPPQEVESAPADVAASASAGDVSVYDLTFDEAVTLMRAGTKLRPDSVDAISFDHVPQWFTVGNVGGAPALVIPLDSVTFAVSGGWKVID
jgi:hypothetical protein